MRDEPRVDVSPLTPAMEEEFTVWLHGIPGSMVYSCLEYLRFLDAAVAGTPVHLVAREGERIVGSLAYFTVTDERFGTVVNSLPWYGSHGGCVLEDLARDDVRVALLDAYGAALARSDLVSGTMVVLPCEAGRRTTYERVLTPSTEDRRIGQISELPLAGDDLEERLERTFRQKTRNLVRKSRRQGFVEKHHDADEHWEYLYATHVENIRAVNGLPKPKRHFESLREKIPASMRRLSVAYLDGRPVAALLLLLFNQTVEYFTPVITHEFRPRQPLSFLVWNAMLEAARAGCRFWNWGGTWVGQSSLHHFKAGWGAEDHPYTYYVVLPEGSPLRIRANLPAMQQSFSHYYLIPYELLDGDTA